MQDVTQAIPNNCLFAREFRWRAGDVEPYPCTHPVPAIMRLFTER